MNIICELQIIKERIAPKQDQLLLDFGSFKISTKARKEYDIKAKKCRNGRKSKLSPPSVLDIGHCRRGLPANTNIVYPIIIILQAAQI
jgi:hypothetical protein